MRCLSANLAVDWQVGGDYRQAARHGFHQRVREGFGVGGGYVDVAGPVHVMEKFVGHASEFDDGGSKVKLVAEQGSAVRAIGSRIRGVAEFAGEDEFHLSRAKSFLDEGHGPHEGLKVPVVGVVADQEKTQHPAGILELGGQFGRRRPGIVEGRGIETVVNGDDLVRVARPDPVLQVSGEGFAGSDRDFGPADGSSRNPGFDLRVEPAAVLMAVLEVSKIVGRDVEGVAA